jgi:hypothetical protein
MTKYLCKAAHHVMSVELDDRLIPLLQGFMAEYDNFTLVHGDVMTVNLPEITKELGIKPEQIRAQMNELSAERIAQRGNIDKDQALSLLNKGYRPMDVSVAAKLAKLSNKDIQTVLDMKKINNRWGDVAEQLGVDRSALRPNMGKGQFPGHGPQGGPPDGGEMPDEK